MARSASYSTLYGASHPKPLARPDPNNARGHAGRRGRCRLLTTRLSTLLGALSLVNCAGDPGADTAATNSSPTQTPIPSSITEETAPPTSAPTSSNGLPVPAAPPSEPDVGEPPAPPAVSRRCVAPEGVSASPRSIEQVVELINALPLPVTIECLLESLERPLDAYATNSFISAQPAEGNKNPRIFLLMGDSLTISIVPTGIGSEVVEFGEYTSDVRSLKGELPFPVTERIGPSAPFTHILSEQTGTVCRLCHSGEAAYPDPRMEDAFDSLAIRPNPVYDVPLADVFTEYQACDAEVEAERCAILRGLFAHGAVQFRDFPEHLPIFF